MSAMRIDALPKITELKLQDGPELPSSGASPTPSVSFEKILGGAIDKAVETSNVADAKADALARGTLDDLHGTMIAAKEAEISLHLVGNIRSKLLDAFHEIWKTNV
jgi:flagellar hook-basal body complex protein FliE